MSECFPKSLRLRKRHHYTRLAYQAKRQVGFYLIIESKSNQLSVSRLGITVSKRYGDAHERNRFKRIVREAFRRAVSRFPVGIDLNVRPRTQAKDGKMDDIFQELITLFCKS